MVSGSKQSGNVLFLILIAVALFAALSFAVTQSTRSGGGSTSKEKASTSAARILNFASSLQSGILRLELANGAKILDLHFDNDVYKAYDGGSTTWFMGTPANPKLFIFHPKGGGVIPETFADIASPCPACGTTYVLPGHLDFRWTNIPNDGTTVSDLAFMIPSLPDDVCMALNSPHNLTTIPSLNLNSDAYPSFYSTPPATPVTTTTPAGVAAVKGLNDFCYKEASSPSRNVFVHIFEMN